MDRGGGTGADGDERGRRPRGAGRARDTTRQAVQLQARVGPRRGDVQAGDQARRPRDVGDGADVQAHRLRRPPARIGEEGDHHGAGEDERRRGVSRVPRGAVDDGADHRRRGRRVARRRAPGRPARARPHGQQRVGARRPRRGRTARVSPELRDRRCDRQGVQRGEVRRRRRPGRRLARAHDRLRGPGPRHGGAREAHRRAERQRWDLLDRRRPRRRQKSCSTRSSSSWGTSARPRRRGLGCGVRPGCSRRRCLVDDRTNTILLAGDSRPTTDLRTRSSSGSITALEIDNNGQLDARRAAARRGGRDARRDVDELAAAEPGRRGRRGAAGRPRRPRTAAAAGYRSRARSRCSPTSRRTS